MRFFVIIAAYIGIASAFTVPGGVASSGDAAVKILKTPLVYQDQVGGEGLPGVLPKFGGGYPGQPGLQTNSYAGADVVGYPGQPGLQTNANTYTKAVAGAVAGGGAGGGAVAGAIAGAVGGAGGSGNANAQVVVRYAKPEVQKNFYYHVAPEDTRTDVGVNTLTITPRKHYKVIFIKAPSNSANSESTAQAASQTEEKTLVYVLVNNKVKANTNSDAKADSFLSGKPEVFFVKYEKPNTQATAISTARAAAGGDGSFANAGSGFGGNSGGGFANANAGAGAGAGYNGDFGRSGSYANAGANAGAGGQTGGFGNYPAYNGGAIAGANAGANSGSYY